MKNQSDSFGNLADFNVGDLVFWKNITEKQRQENIEYHAAKKKFGVFMKAEKYIILPTIILKFEQKGNFYEI